MLRTRLMTTTLSLAIAAAAGFAPAVVDHVLLLVRRHEWKRQQAAPGPKISRRAFGRERRYPITNAYVQDLATAR